MTKRKKRLEKGIESLKEQIEIHKEKKKQAEKASLQELVAYYEKEIEAKEEAKREKQELLDKQ
jgi:hypothetical protein